MTVVIDNLVKEIIMCINKCTLYFKELLLISDKFFEGDKDEKRK